MTRPSARCGSPSPTRRYLPTVSGDLASQRGSFQIRRRRNSFPPASSGGSGSFFLLRSCDKFRPSLELDDLGHGLFTQGLLDAMDARDGRLAACDTSFAAAVRDRMEELQRRHNVAEPQRPSLGEVSGACFALFTDGFLNAGRAAPSAYATPAAALVKCPVCGRWNEKINTFTCRECGRDNICLRHQDEATYLCADCVAKARVEAQLKAAEERARRDREEAERKAEESKRKAAREVEERNRPAGTQSIIRVGEIEVALRWCPPGTFMMGSSKSEEGRDDVETQHQVTLTKGFWMGETEVTQGLWKKIMTQGLWEKIMGKTPSSFKSGDNYPVESVSWEDCQDFLRKLNAKAPVAGFKWALPTEAQWEYACRAGTTGPYGGTVRLDDMGWFASNSGGTTHPVASKMANAWGLHDMHGNVWEWCQDWYGTYSGGAQTDPSGPSTGSGRVIRGGSWCDDARDCRPADRGWCCPVDRDDNLGFRVALLPVQ